MRLYHVSVERFHNTEKTLSTQLKTSVVRGCLLDQISGSKVRQFLESFSRSYLQLSVLTPLSPIMGETTKKQNCLPASSYREGTSRAIFFREQDLPQNRTGWTSIFCGTLGVPDPNGWQLDGLGGGISSFI